MSDSSFDNILLDIALPYFHPVVGQPDDVYYGRYLLYNKKILGIKLCTSKSEIKL